MEVENDLPASQSRSEDRQTQEWPSIHNFRWHPDPRPVDKRMIDNTNEPLLQYAPQEGLPLKRRQSPEIWEAKTEFKNPRENTLSNEEMYKLSPHGLMCQLVNIQQHQISRETASSWACNLRFLTGCITPPNPHENTDRSSEAPVPPHKMYECCCTWIPNSYCKTEVCACREKARPLQESCDFLRVVQIPHCLHYVAISYRWRDRALGVKAPTSQEHSMDSSTTSFSTVLERSAAFANRYSYRLLWVDQISILQNDPHDRALGMVGMDLVYERAAVSLAVLDCTIETQEQIENLALAIGDHPNPLEDKEEWDLWVRQMRLSKMYAMGDVLKIIAGDLYFTRAWTAQENTAATSTILLIRCSPDLSKPANMGSSPCDLELPLCLFRRACATIYSALLYYHENVEYYPDKSSMRAMHQRFYNKSEIEVMWRTYKRDVAQSGQLSDYLDKVLHTLPVHVPHGVRPHHSAAEAALILATRSSLAVSDRLAIAANLCGYQVRLDTMQLEALGYDLAACLLCLSLLNGDLSLAKLHDGLTFKDVGVKEFSMEGVILSMGGPERICHRLNMEIGLRMFSWAPRLIESFSERRRTRSDDLRYELRFLGQPPVLCIYGRLWRRHRVISCANLQEAFKKRFPTEEEQFRARDPNERWQMTLNGRLDCFWEIFDHLRKDAELRSWTQELWKTLLILHEAYAAKERQEHLSFDRTFRFYAQSIQQSEAGALTERMFLESLTRKAKIETARITWMIQTISVFGELHCFRLEQETATSPTSHLEHFGIFNTPNANTIFTPQVRRVERMTRTSERDDQFIPEFFKYSWFVETHTYDAAGESGVEALGDSVREITEQVHRMRYFEPRSQPAASITDSCEQMPSCAIRVSASGIPDTEAFAPIVGLCAAEGSHIPRRPYILL